MRRLRASGPEETRLEWLKRLRNTKPSPGLTEVMHAKGWIEGGDAHALAGSATASKPRDNVMPRSSEAGAPKPRRVWGKRVRTEYFREYMRAYRERKRKAKEK